MNKNKQIFTGWLIDGSGGPIQKDILIEICEGLIKSVETVSPDQIPSRDTRTPDILDLRHCTAIPGMIDTHVHLAWSGTNDLRTRQHQLKANFEEVKQAITKHLHQHLAHGVVAVRDGGNKNGHVLRYKELHLDRNKTPVHLHSAGSAWYREGRYGGLLGRALSSNDSLADAIAHDKATIDHIKVVNSGLNSLTEFGIETPPQFQLKEMVEAVKVAEKRGLTVMVHANGSLPVSIALDSGCHSVEHGFFMGRENLEKMAERDVIWVPTVGTMKAYSELLRPGTVESEIARKTQEHQLEQVSEAHRLNVPMALGTDAGSPGVYHGSGIIEESKLFLSAGLSIPEAVRCATLNAAKLLGRSKLGLLASGMEATFIALKGAPSEFPDNLTRIEMMFIEGVRY